MLSFSNEELWTDGEDQPRATCKPVTNINAWLPNGKLVSLVDGTYAKRAGSGMEANLYGGGFKSIDIDEFIEVVNKQDWKDRANLQLWVKGGDDESFTQIKLKRRRRLQQSVKSKSKIFFQ